MISKGNAEYYGQTEKNEGNGSTQRVHKILVKLRLYNDHKPSELRCPSPEAHVWCLEAHTNALEGKE